MMSLMTDEELVTILSRLEQQEVDCQTGSGAVPGESEEPKLTLLCQIKDDLNIDVYRSFSVSVYCELLACYLASQPPDLPQAKFLMQRVPQSVKESEEGAELVRLWKIGKNLWTPNTAEVYSSLAGPWSDSVQRIMDKVGRC